MHFYQTLILEYEIIGWNTIELSKAENVNCHIAVVRYSDESICITDTVYTAFI